MEEQEADQEEVEEAGEVEEAHYGGGLAGIIPTSVAALPHHECKCTAFNSGRIGYEEFLAYPYQGR